MPSLVRLVAAGGLEAALSAPHAGRFTHGAYAQGGAGHGGEGDRVSVTDALECLLAACSAPADTHNQAPIGAEVGVEGGAEGGAEAGAERGPEAGAKAPSSWQTAVQAGALSAAGGVLGFLLAGAGKHKWQTQPGAAGTSPSPWRQPVLAVRLVSALLGGAAGRGAEAEVASGELLGSRGGLEKVSFPVSYAASNYKGDADCTFGGQLFVAGMGWGENE